MKKSIYFILALTVIIFTACDKSEEDFMKAQQLGTKQAYEDFLVKHPDCGFTIRAKFLIDSLTTINGGCILSQKYDENELGQFLLVLENETQNNLLKEIGDYFIEDTSRILNYRQALQAAFIKANNFHGFEHSDITENHVKLRKVIESNFNVPAFSYERELINNLHTKFLILERNEKIKLENARLDKLMKKEGSKQADRFSKNANSGNIFEMMAKTVRASDAISAKFNKLKKESSAKIKDEYAKKATEHLLQRAKSLNLNELDVCAKKVIWDFIMTAIEKNPQNEFKLVLNKSERYPTDGSLEITDQLVQELKKSFSVEKNEAIQKIANNCIARFES